ncbi:MAG TPA: helix-turn-helix transcriptional regulator [Clostridia bacterium]|nr:helix-turn-helix transcriptional regulator [Clostridia bacterium]
MGDLVDSPFALHHSYQNANRAAGCGLLRSSCRIVSASQAQATQAAGGYVYPDAEEKQLLHVFLSPDPAQAVSIAQRIVQKLEDANLGQPLQRSIYISVLHALQHTLSCARILSERGGGYIHNFLLRTEAEAAQTGGQFVSLISLLSGELQNRSIDETPLIQRGVAYIQEHYASYELSLSTVAEHVDLSPSYLTRLFREATGHSVKETIDQIRMQHARALLEQTDLSVSKIAEQVGYLSIDSFSRKFKALEGVAPNQYRTLARTKNG